MELFIYKWETIQTDFKKQGGFVFNLKCVTLLSSILLTFHKWFIRLNWLKPYTCRKWDLSDSKHLFRGQRGVVFQLFTLIHIHFSFFFIVETPAEMSLLKISVWRNQHQRRGSLQWLCRMDQLLSFLSSQMLTLQFQHGQFSFLFSQMLNYNVNMKINRMWFCLKYMYALLWPRYCWTVTKSYVCNLNGKKKSHMTFNAVGLHRVFVLFGCRCCSTFTRRATRVISAGMYCNISTTMFCVAAGVAQASQEKLPHGISAGMCCNMVVYASSFKYHDVLLGYR